MSRGASRHNAFLFPSGIKGSLLAGFRGNETTYLGLRRTWRPRQCCSSLNVHFSSLQRPGGEGLGLRGSGPSGWAVLAETGKEQPAT